MKIVKWLSLLGSLGLLGTGGWYFWKQSGDSPPEYRTAPVTRGDIVQAVTASGQVNPVVSVQVGSQISGMIQQLYVDYNSSVTQGQVIAELDAATYRATVHQNEGELANARAGLELARVNAQRAANLLKDRLLPTSDYDKAMADLHQAEAQIVIRDAMLERSQVDLKRCTIYAPTNGIVISRNVDVGQTVAASLSAPTLFVIANDLSKMQIDAAVSEADIGGVELDQMVNFTVDAFPYRTFTGRVIQIRNAPSTNQNVVTYDTVVSVENRDQKLKPGMTANVSIIVAQHDNVLKIPNGALRFKPTGEVKSETPAVAATGGSGAAGPGAARGGGGRGDSSGARMGGGGGRLRGERSNVRTVYTLAAAPTGSTDQPAPVPKAQTIKIGISDGTSTEVLEGLEEGENVVVGLNVTQPPAGATPTANPFGGGPRRF